MLAKLAREYAALHRVPSRLKKYPEVFEQIMEDKEAFEAEFVAMKCAAENLAVEVTAAQERVDCRATEAEALRAEVAELDRLTSHFAQTAAAKR